MFSTAKRLRNKAQGCRVAATLGNEFIKILPTLKGFATPER